MSSNWSANPPGTGSDPFDENWTPTDETTRRRAWDQVLSGLLLVAAGVLWLVDTASDLSVPWRTLLPIALVVVGLATVVLALRRPAGELIGLGVVLTVAVVVSALAPAQLGFTIGERSERPTTIDEPTVSYGHGIGSLEVDLERLELSESTTVEIGVGIGELRIVVPEGVPLDVRATAGVGEVEVLDRRSSGVGAKVEELFEDDNDGPTLRIEASVGVGQIRVVQP